MAPRLGQETNSPYSTHMKATTLVIASLAAACTWSAHSAIVISPVSISITGADEFFPAVNLINGSGLEVPLNSGDTLPVISNHIYGNGADNSWVSGAFGFPSDWYASSGTIPTFVLDLGKQSLLD